MEHSFMYQLGYTIGYLIGVVGVLIAFGTVASLLLLPIVAVFFPDKLISYWKKRLGRVAAYGFTTLPVDGEKQAKEGEDEVPEESTERRETDPAKEKVPSQEIITIKVAGVPIEIYRSGEPGRPAVAH